MSQARDATIERLFHEALERPPEERARFIDGHAPGPRARDEALVLPERRFSVW